ncbi:hypothetical protein A5707_10565 [Mycobacterium kyorinense]|uniref:Alanine, arginine and proline rich protein n=1 Tax=Mycobacterium kyorinense TaxID=487514 RepID=A0A1A2YTT6_9MYCO|nr:Rv3235 family protein [Mycobacterium kyorinense]OBI40341.1 hypothetical protein A5707_10565 [Mycobacterium kyorinense]
MSIVSPVPGRAVFAVRPVADYEPPPRDVRHCRPPSAAALRRINAHAPQRFSGHQQPTTSMSPRMRQAAVFADAALRRVLEVIDRRRPVAQLHGLLAGGLADSVLAANRVTGHRQEAAVLRRLRLQAVGPPDRLTAAEVFATYTRGCRVHAIACRVEPVTDVGWQVVALHIG